MFIKKIGIVVLLTWLSAISIGIVFDIRYKKRWSTLYFQKTDQLVRDSVYYDVIYLGNSRVHFGINPYYVDSITGLSSYNFGMGGSDATELSLIANLYLQNHRPPKAVVISLDLGAFAPAYAIKTRYPYFFYMKNDTVCKYVKEVYPAAAAIPLLPFLKYSFFDEYNRTSLFTNGTPYPVFEHNIYRGFLNIHTGENFNEGANYNNPPEDSLVISEASKIYLENTISNFLNVGTKVIIISPPERPGLPGHLPAAHKLRDSMIQIVAGNKDVQHLHFRNSAVMESKFFTDNIHLSDRGAKVFSIELAKAIKPLL